MPQPVDRRGLVFAVVVAVVAAIGLWAIMGPDSEEEPPPPPRAGADTAAPPVSRPLATASDGPFDVYAYLPMDRRQLAAAADLAVRFTVAYGTFRYDEEPSAYAERVKVFATGELADFLTKSLTSPVTVQQNREERTVATATAVMKEIRQVAKTSVVFVVTSTQKLDGADGAKEKTEDLAVTLTPVGDDWRVFDVQQAAEGQDGDAEG
ncbi:hypothetical protein [Nonomuraea longicatena]|uniref:Integral membrane protein n=1 Tax=Nonomuraea longicatena TaxID=83682 RepID=A0ABN1QZS2_9ACTN